MKCTKCDNFKTPEEFALCKSNPRGRHSYCKACMSEYMSNKRLKVDHPPRSCEAPDCDIEFVPKDVRKRFCSIKCKQRTRNARIQAGINAAKIGKICAAETCDNDISHMRGDAKWCSDACAMRERSPELRRKYRLSSMYGMAIEDYDHMIKTQGDKCAICKRSDPNSKYNQWHIDHCHETGVIRGILCSTCNVGLGNFYDNPDLLLAAAQYLIQSQVKKVA